MSVPIQSPSSYLPPIKTLSQCSAERLSKAITYLRLIYNPEVRGIRRTGHNKRSSPSLPSSSPSAIAEHETLLDELRADSFERSYAIRWLTALITSQTFHDSTEGKEYEDEEGENEDGREEQMEREALIRGSASLLAVCAGAASAGTLTRVFRFALPYAQSHLYKSSGDDHAAFPDGGPQEKHTTDAVIEVQLTDMPLENHDYTSVGAQTWGSACLLSEMLVESPEAFGLLGGDKGRNFRVLELGAGTGLASLTLAKWFEWASRYPEHKDRDEETAAVEAQGVNKGESEDQGCSNEEDMQNSVACARGLGAKHCRSCTIVATDFHPFVLANLRRNIEANFVLPPTSDLSPRSQWILSPSESHSLPLHAVATQDKSDSRSHQGTASASAVSVGVHFLDWSQFSQASPHDDIVANFVDDARVGDEEPEASNDTHECVRPSSPFDEPFDLVLGADIIYEPEHAQWVKACLGKLLRRPSLPLAPPSSHAQEMHHTPLSLEKIGLNGECGSGNGCTCVDTNSASPPRSSHSHSHSLSYATDRLHPSFHLVIPLRPTHTLESNTIEELFPFHTRVATIRGDGSREMDIDEEKDGHSQLVSDFALGAYTTSENSDGETAMPNVPTVDANVFSGSYKAKMTPSSLSSQQGEDASPLLVLAIIQKERISCEVDYSLRWRTNGRRPAEDEEVEYMHYVIGWVPQNEVGH